jgi:predicted transcriptional regulator
MRQLKLETLRREIQAGLEQEAAGELLAAEEVFGRLKEVNKTARKVRGR